MSVIRVGDYADASEWAIHDWTPTIDNVVVGAGAASTGWYQQAAGLVTAHFVIVFGTTPSFSSTILLNLPVAADVDYLQAWLGGWVLRDTSVPDHYSGALAAWSAAGSQASFSGAWDPATSKPNTRATTGKPITVAVGDVLTGGLKYRDGS
jgi:hypothetical protein